VIEALYPDQPEVPEPNEGLVVRLAPGIEVVAALAGELSGANAAIRNAETIASRHIRVRRRGSDPTRRWPPSPRSSAAGEAFRGCFIALVCGFKMRYGAFG
jgi:hypothetical protein